MADFERSLSPSSVTSDPSTCPTSPSADPISFLEAQARLFDTFHDAREIVRVLQCKVCSKPLRGCMTLPCGNSICGQCLPRLHRRLYISYPTIPARLEGFICPECRVEHSSADCKSDISLNNIMQLIREGIEVFRPKVNSLPIRLEAERPSEDRGMSSIIEKQKSGKVYHGGFLFAIFMMAEQGELPWDAELSYMPLSQEIAEYRLLDMNLLIHLRNLTQPELDCQVCYNFFVDPITSVCGHTFCRSCLLTHLDHTSPREQRPFQCPLCRQHLPFLQNAASGLSSYNKTLLNLLESLCPEAMADRRKMLHQQEQDSMNEFDTPLFICTLALPGMPTFLHIFEHRYRRMIKQAMEGGGNQFGMLLPTRSPRGDLDPKFHRYGTMLRIINCHVFPDGRSMIETRGLYRFRVLKHGEKDGYTVGKVERVGDMSFAAEEAIEAHEIMIDRLLCTPTARLDLENSQIPVVAHIASDISIRRMTLPDLDRIPTTELLNISTDFVDRMQALSAPWLRRRTLQVYGEYPKDAAEFPWWLASVIPIVEEEKYRLLETNRVRERLKICVGWILRIDAETTALGQLRCS